MTRTKKPEAAVDTGEEQKNLTSYGCRGSARMGGGSRLHSERISTTTYTAGTRMARGGTQVKIRWTSEEALPITFMDELHL